MDTSIKVIVLFVQLSLFVLIVFLHKRNGKSLTTDKRKLVEKLQGSWKRLLSIENLVLFLIGLTVYLVLFSIMESSEDLWLPLLLGVLALICLKETIQILSTRQ